ncbi:Prophage antirepressor [Pseudomonas congelans]|uniref:Prophage antirepressor n=1 Tax=Pseudomonas congelans TaxID=200452 RepID=A0A0P9NH03_9PSED|nr:Bro-N domain-containing protein [Pseudomonas congelans]KPW83292.1 putative prophage antirepressor, BRO-domain protein [Pseudomonas congelans]SDP18994.1 Prophage antirepressor [Pseudomonas congelans]
MFTATPCVTHTPHFEATLFLRHRRTLRAIFTESQAWFCLADLARLMGRALDERATLKLDADQRREVWLEAHGECQRQLMISESGVLALLVHHYVPENRALRQWLTHEVLTTLHDQQNVTLDNPRMSQLQWPGTSLSVLHWRSETWVRLRDMPNVVAEAAPRPKRPLWRRVLKHINPMRNAA